MRNSVSPRAPDAAGMTALSSEPGSALIVIGRKKPALIGISRPRTQRVTRYVADSVIDSVVLSCASCLWRRAGEVDDQLIAGDGDRCSDRDWLVTYSVVVQEVLE